MKQLVIAVLICVSAYLQADEGTFRHVLVGFGTSAVCQVFIGGMLRLEKPERWKSTLICMGGLLAGSLAMEGIQAQERNAPLDIGDIGNNVAGGALATALYLTIPLD